jgi:glycosyltransferase involved in cell wall biosynthesis
MPKVSIVLPNLNNRQYLDERLQSICNQTLYDWELIVVDSYSTDGAWEFFQECSQRDDRIRIYQSKEKGIYNNLNKCIEMARGEYIYIATSDDSMTSDALEKMVNALEVNPGCDLAHCKLRIVDTDSNVSTQRLWDNFFIIRYFGDLIDQNHIRKAPHDGLLHFSGITVYTSLTQLLIKRSLFDRVGLFLENYGAEADYEWVMRATLIANTVHIPEYLATWRFHSSQATSDNRINKAKASGQFLRMACHALKIARKLNPDIVKPLKIKKLKYILEKEKLYHEIKDIENEFIKKWIYLKWSFINPRLIKEFKRAKEENRDFLSQADSLAYIKKMVKEHHLEKKLVIIKE